MRKLLSAAVAIALLAPLPATAATIMLDDVSVQFPDFWNQLLADGARGAFITQALDWDNFYASFPQGTLFVAGNNAFYVVDNYGTVVGVPEPATWLMLLIGLALLGRAGRSWKPRPALAARDCSHL